MTTAPGCLKEARTFLYTNLDIHPGTNSYPADLDPNELGIVGDTAHVVEGNSYHLGLPEQSATGYAATESPRDKAGLSEYASALDVGWFEIRVDGKAHNLRTFSVWLVAQCKAGAVDTLDIREIIYSPDGVTVKRWDRLAKRTSGDSSHLYHTHVSYFRDATKANRSQVALFKRYLIYIGFLEEDVSATDVFNYAIYNPITETNAKFATFVQSINSGVYSNRLLSEAILAKVAGESDQAILDKIEATGQQLQAAVANVDEAVAERLSTTDLDTLVRILVAAGVDKQALAAKLAAS